MLGLPPARFDSADASTLDNKIALYQLNAWLGHPCKVIEKTLKLLIENALSQLFCDCLTVKENLSSEKMNAALVS